MPECLRVRDWWPDPAPAGCGNRGGRYAACLGACPLVGGARASAPACSHVVCCFATSPAPDHLVMPSCQPNCNPPHAMPPLTLGRTPPHTHTRTLLPGGYGGAAEAASTSLAQASARCGCSGEASEAIASSTATALSTNIATASVTGVCCSKHASKQGVPRDVLTDIVRATSNALAD